MEGFAVKPHNRKAPVRELDPTSIEVAAMARALGTMLFAGVPILECISVVAEITPNACLQKVVKELYAVAREQKSIGLHLMKYPKIFTTDFISEVEKGGEGKDLGQVLLQYAFKEKLAGDYVSNQIGRSEELRIFTGGMVKYLTAGESVLAALSLCAQEFEGVFMVQILEIRDDLERREALSTAMGKKSAVFDRMYVNVVRAGEMYKSLPLSFKLLSNL